KIQGFLFSFLPGNSFHLHRSKSHVVENGLMRKQIKVLEYHSHFLTQLIDIELYCFSFGIFIFFLCDINAVENDRPPSRFFQQVQASEKRGFSRTGRTDDSDYIALIYIHSNTVQSLDSSALVIFFQISDLNHAISCLHGSFSFLHMRWLWMSGNTDRNRSPLPPAMVR